MIPDKLEQESKRLKDAVIEAINNFKFETNLVPMVEVVIKQQTLSCSTVTQIEVTVKVEL